MIDVRLRPSSQLSGFAKVSQSDGDFQFLLRRLCGMDYVHVPDLAPSEELFKRYRGGDLTWDEYAERYLDLLSMRASSTSWTASCSPTLSCSAAKTRRNGATAGLPLNTCSSTGATWRSSISSRVRGSIRRCDRSLAVPLGAWGRRLARRGTCRPRSLRRLRLRRLGSLGDALGVATDQLDGSGLEEQGANPVVVGEDRESNGSLRSASPAYMAAQPATR